MRKLLIVGIVLAFVLAFGAPNALAVSDAPMECFAPNYAGWAAWGCQIYILCFVLYVCSTPPPILDPQTVTPIDAPPPRAKSIEAGDADGVSG